MKNPTIPPRSKKPAKPIKLEEIEIDSDAWPKFEKLVRSAAKMGPKPHDTKSGKRGGSG